MHTAEELVSLISRGRTDLVVDLFEHDDWQRWLDVGPVRLIQWLVYYNDTTAIRALLAANATLDSIDLDGELGNAAFFGHWKVCDLLIEHGANVNAVIDKTGETPLFNALSKAGRPYYRYVVQLLLEQGAEVNVATVPGVETGAFMRDVRTRGESPLHRAAAYADESTVRLLLDHGADRSVTDAHGDSPLTWASRHLRPGRILRMLAFGDHRVSEAHARVNTSDHGAGWGNAMDWNLYGEYLPTHKL